ncbi:hypothetical protein ACWA2C_16615 [Priestia megaterium]|jgi:hypothetical protein|nr:hypothetical protein [Priestia megaterium]
MVNKGALLEEDTMTKKPNQKSERDIRMEKIMKRVVNRNYEGLKRLSKN